jgi:hypothetical protein
MVQKVPGETVPMISLDLARRLRDAGVPWTPGNGDRFVVPDRDLDNVVFVVSDMVVEVHDLPMGRLLAFNGTTEWALDSILQQDVLWLPREEQLRELLGDRFRALSGTPGGYVVVVDQDGTEQRHIDIDAECAYARALLALHDADGGHP